MSFGKHIIINTNEGELMIPNPNDPVMKFTISTATILGAMSNGGYWPLVGPQGEDVIVAPAGDIRLIYRPGTVAFGGNPALMIGYLTGAQAAFAQATLGISQLTPKFRICVPNGAFDDLIVFTNQPLVVAFANASATYGPIASSSKVNGGSGYIAPQNFFFSEDAEATGTILTVDENGAVLTYQINTPGTSIPPGTGSPSAGNHVATSHLVNGSGGWLPGDGFEVGGGDIRPHGVVDTVVDIEGRVLTYHLTNPGQGVSLGDVGCTPEGDSEGQQFTISIDSVVGSGFELDVKVIQGNGHIEVYFEPEITNIG